ncbi:MAG: hypothetical protein WC091_02740 [Sulfuricellaceae bacterium]
MMTIEKLGDKIQLNIWTGEMWERNLFDTTDEMEIYCHENGLFCE